MPRYSCTDVSLSRHANYEYILWWNIVGHYLVIDSFRCHDPDWSSLVAAKDSSLLLWVEKLITSVSSIIGCAIVEHWCKTSALTKKNNNIILDPWNIFVIMSGFYVGGEKSHEILAKWMSSESGCTISSVGKASDIDWRKKLFWKISTLEIHGFHRTVTIIVDGLYLYCPLNKLCFLKMLPLSHGKWDGQFLTFVQ